MVTAALIRTHRRRVNLVLFGVGSNAAMAPAVVKDGRRTPLRCGDLLADRTAARSAKQLVGERAVLRARVADHGGIALGPNR